VIPKLYPNVNTPEIPPTHYSSKTCRRRSSRQEAHQDWSQRVFQFHVKYQKKNLAGKLTPLGFDSDSEEREEDDEADISDNSEDEDSLEDEEDDKVKIAHW
jgi:hypothetical protein